MCSKRIQKDIIVEDIVLEVFGEGLRRFQNVLNIGEYMIIYVFFSNSRPEFGMESYDIMIPLAIQIIPNRQTQATQPARNCVVS